MPSEPAPADGEPTSFREKAKSWAEKHETAFRVVKAVGTTVGAAVAIMVVKHVMTQNVTEYADDDQATEYAEGDQATEDDQDAKDKRRPPVRHSVTEHTRTLADGRVIPIAPYKRGSSSEDEGEDPDEVAA
ncbi:hypothetical protein EF908_38645 [Streptomyces sp. WAC04770]|nr:hypothetical protein [Streptomyces sp. WAC04770]RST12081.1 hypothetical protein EF908_38645 [Streptomyces sp. WAC04770]